MCSSADSISVVGICSRWVRNEVVGPQTPATLSLASSFHSDAELIAASRPCCSGFTFTLCSVAVNPVAGCQNLNCSRRIAP